MACADGRSALRPWILAATDDEHRRCRTRRTMEWVRRDDRNEPEDRHRSRQRPRARRAAAAVRHAHRHRDRPPDAPPGDRRVADQGQEDRAATWATTTSSSRPSATSATCRAAPPTSRPSTRASRGRGSAWTSTTTSQPLYIVTPEKKGKVAELQDALKSVDELLLATDPDREGEAIAWHLLDTLKPKVPVRRMVFHEITEPAIRAAAGEPARPRPGPRRRPGDPPHPGPPLRLRGLPGAVEEGHAEAVGGPGAVGGHADHRAARARADGVRRRRLLGHRRDARRRVREATPRTFPARAGRRRRRPRRHRPRLRPGRAAARRTRRVLDEGSARRLAEALAGPRPGRRVGRVEALHAQALRAVHDLDAAAGGGRKLRFSAERTMRSAQRLYENGYITYMRTDSTTLSESAIDAARAQARELYGDAYVPPHAAAVHPQGQERAGGARGHPAGRGDVPHPGPGRPRGRRRRLPALRADLAAHRRLADGRRARHHGQRADHRAPPAPARSARSPRPAARSRSPASSRPTSRPSTTQAGGEADDAESRLPELTAGPGADRRRAARRTATPPTRPPATPRRAWSRRWRSWASAGRRRTRRSSRRSRTAATCGRRAARWCRPGSRSR